jgi:hypothetical protein
MLIALGLATGTILAFGLVEQEKTPPVDRVETDLPPPKSGSHRFVENLGQWPSDTRFVGTFPGLVVRAEVGGVSWQVFEASDPSRGVLVRVRFAAAFDHVEPEGSEPLEGRYNYFLGNDPSGWHSGARAFGSIRYAGLWEGVDLVLHIVEGRLKYDLEVAPGAELEQVVLECEGIRGLAMEPDGALMLEAGPKWIRQPPPVSWQELPTGERRAVACAYVPMGTRAFGFDCPDRDPGLPLVVDPELVWSTYLGGSDIDWATAVALAEDGDAIVTGLARSLDFPTSPGAYQASGGNDRADVFVTRLRARDGAVVYSSLIGGTKDDRGYAIATVSSEGVLVAGDTLSTDFPTTRGAFDRVKHAINDSVFVLRLSPDGGDLIYSTFLEGDDIGGSAQANAVALTDSGAGIIVGTAHSADFPTTPGSYDPTFNGPGKDVFVTRFAPDGGSLEWSTFIGGLYFDRGLALEMDAQETLTLAGYSNSFDFPATIGAYSNTKSGGEDAFVARLSAQGDDLIWATFLGGSFDDRGISLGLAPRGGVIVCGQTNSFDFPATPGAFQENYTPGSIGAWRDGFVARLDPNGSSLIYSTFVGGQGDEALFGVDVDASGLATVTGFMGTNSGLPMTPGAFSTNPPTQSQEILLARFDPQGQRFLYATFLGSLSRDAGLDVKMTESGRVTVSGESYGFGYPTTPGVPGPVPNGGQTDGVVTTMDLLLAGVTEYGGSAPACMGLLRMGVTEMPAAGASGFSVYCSGAPPLAAGIVVVGQPNPQRTSVFGASLLIRPARPWTSIPVLSGVDGYVETPLSLRTAIAGAQFACQYLFQNTAACGGTGSWSSSNALTITVQ